MDLQKKIKIARLLTVFLVIFLLISGILLLFVPSMAALLYDIPDKKDFNNPIAHGMGIRQFTLGVMFAVVLFTNQWRALSYLLLICALIPIADFVIFGPTIGWVSSLRHASSVPFVIGLGFFIRSLLNKN